MTKHVELKTLLYELQIAVRSHDRANNFSTSPSEKLRPFHEADRAQKRVFSFFDALQRELDVSASEHRNLQKQRDFIAKERDELRAKLEAPASARKCMPFDEKRVKAGDPVECRPKGADDYCDAYFVGMLSNGGIAVEISGTVFSHPPSLVRMKAKPAQVLQMFATLYKGSDGKHYGYLFEDLNKSNSWRLTGANEIARNMPVSITVTL